ncbi:uncharacterized protein LOC130054023 [Ostrea edulis]|uniref:uncharacterized protein LOC130054023 n=1 Tax=Ostrea edulis TaxID=37623 RepID=UPI0024AFE51A|nr:uncharacterized protein LOC130054023 [Ostrea edulis]
MAEPLKMTASVDVNETVTSKAEEVSTPAPVAATVTSVRSTAKVNATKAEPQIKEASDVKTKTTTRKTVSTSKKTVQYQADDILGDLSRNYRGTSPAVLEGIAHHPALFSRAYEPVNPRLSAKSKKIIRDTADLAIFSPGLKNLLEVEYSDLTSRWLQIHSLFLLWLFVLWLGR